MSNELDVANKYGLFWGGAYVEGKDGQTLADGLYIYQPERFSEGFFHLFDKLRQLNDHCFHQLLSAESRLQGLETGRDAALRQKFGDAAEIDYYDDQVGMWEDNVEVIAKATSVVLLCSFVEWGLKLVAKELQTTISFKPDRKLSDIEFMLQHIERECNLHLRLHDEIMPIVGSFRIIRNAFAHGHWATLNEQLGTLSLRTCFRAVSRLFQSIEEAAWESPWGAVSP